MCNKRREPAGTSPPLSQRIEFPYFPSRLINQLQERNHHDHHQSTWTYTKKKQFRDDNYKNKDTYHRWSVLGIRRIRHVRTVRRDMTFRLRYHPTELIWNGGPGRNRWRGCWRQTSLCLFVCLFACLLLVVVYCRCSVYTICILIMFWLTVMNEKMYQCETRQVVSRAERTAKFWARCRARRAGPA